MINTGCPKSLSNSQRLPVKICIFAVHCRRAALRQRELTASLGRLGPEQGYLHGTVVCVQGHAMQLAVRFGSLSSWACSWQVLAKRQWKAIELSAEHVSQQKFWSSGCARGGAGGASAVLHTSVRQRHFYLHMEIWCCVPRHRHRKWHGRLARRQNIRWQTACLLCDGPLARPRVRCAAADGRDPSHGSATRLL